MLRKKPEFPGELGRLIKWVGPLVSIEPSTFLNSPAGTDAKANEKASRSAIIAMSEKIHLLEKRYNIEQLDPKERSRTLLFCVCNEFIPGFQIDYRPKQRGAPRIRDLASNMQLLEDIDSLLTKGVKSVRKACEILIREAQAAGHGRYSVKMKKEGRPTSIRQAIDSLAARVSEARKFKYNQIAAISQCSDQWIKRESLVNAHRSRTRPKDKI